eukprot:CAMPEP_0204616394 /NCGR_PEP_ID=MMETSP0717-20131115/3648_1 /ASSEMBLY_ACC=CAM_ASM_000666 /TAXON_ID=230516 /ORGANISM="Chaetoceros curvisetus" /LENGTH=101 /DNA_ID=CAMNT_0051629627 /DNA_START=398 /DNA_END=703 /DNA_ORIENTATION=+
MNIQYNSLFQPTSQKRDYAQCQIFAKKISNIKDLPDECFAHKDIVASFQTSSRGGADAPDPFAGMGGAAAAAISARKKGQENYAQIQRRLTNSRRFTKEKK